MAACPAAPCYLDPALRQIQVIMQNQQITQADAKIVQIGTYALARTVHVGLRLHAKNLRLQQSSLSKEPLHFQTAQPPTVFIGKSVQKINPGIMPGQFIGRARISQPCHEKFFYSHRRNSVKYTVQPHNGMAK